MTPDDGGLFGFGLIPEDEASRVERRLEAQEKREREAEVRRGRFDPEDVSPECRKCLQAAVNAMGLTQKVRVNWANWRSGVEDFGHGNVRGQPRGTADALRSLRDELRKMARECGIPWAEHERADLHDPVQRVEDALDAITEPGFDPTSPEDFMGPTDLRIVADSVHDTILNAVN